MAENESKKEENKAKFAEAQKKRKIQAEMRSAWSEQKERKARKEERRDKKDKRKAAEWAAQGGHQEDIGPVEAFRRAKRGVDADEAVMAGSDDEGEKEDFDHEYKALKKEVKAERLAKKSRKEASAPTGMFDGLD